MYFRPISLLRVKIKFVPLNFRRFYGSALPWADRTRNHSRRALDRSRVRKQRPLRRLDRHTRGSSRARAALSRPFDSRLLGPATDPDEPRADVPGSRDGAERVPV